MVEPNAPLTDYNVVTELDDVASTEANVLISTCDFGISFLSITKTSHVKKKNMTAVRQWLVHSRVLRGFICYLVCIVGTEMARLTAFNF